MNITCILTQRGVVIPAVVALLVGCGNGGSQAPLGLSGPVQNTVPSDLHAQHGRSWMVPDAKKGDLLYISAQADASIFVYSWPKGQMVGQLQSGFLDPSGECVDRVGNIFMVDSGEHEIFEFAHGGTSPIAVLTEPGEQFPNACAVNKKNGDLAVINTAGSPGSSVAIYKHAQGSPKFYTDSNFSNILFGGYDNKGNLYVDGFSSTPSQFRFAELAKGSASFTDITLNQIINYPGDVQWDGRYVAVEDQGAGQYPYQSVIYQFTISANSGTVVGSTPLGETGDIVFFEKQGSKLIAPNGQYGNVLVYDYPAGGTPIKTIPLNEGPQAAVVSKPTPTPFP